MQQIFIGIDFSLKSPAICILQNNEYTWLSHCSKIEKPKKNVKYQEDIESLKNVKMTYHSGLLSGNDYSSNDFTDILNYRTHADTLIKMIKRKLPKIKSSCIIHIAYEGYSFNSFSRSDNIIDIVAATSIFKDKLITFLELNEYEYTIDIAAPIILKKFAGYSKFDKVDMFQIFTGQIELVKEHWNEAIQKDYDKKVLKGKPSVFKFDYHDDLLNVNNPFYKYCMELELDYTLKKVNIPKPIDDMIDSYFACNWIKSLKVKKI